MNRTASSTAVPATGTPPPLSFGNIPLLAFSIVGVEAVRHSATPSLCFRTRIDAPDAQAIRSVVLDVQVQIAARQRGYNAEEEDLLQELFGTPDRWSNTLRTLPWARVTVTVPPFQGATETQVTIPCSYDLEVTGARYLAGVTEGHVPLELLFTGAVFFTTPTGALQTTRIANDSEATCQLPVSVWREAMDRHFPASAWLRLSRERFEALYAFRARHALAGWDATVDALLEAAEGS